jgi:hypothetical protein
VYCIKRRFTIPCACYLREMTFRIGLDASFSNMKQRKLGKGGKSHIICDETHVGFSTNVVYLTYCHVTE